MRTILIAAALLVLAGCQQPNVATQDDDYETTTPQTGASVGAAAAEVTPPERFAYVGSKDDSLETIPSVLRDRATGCEYIVTTLFQNETDISPRLEPTDKGVVQRCVSPSKGTGYVWIGTPLSVRVSTLRDLQTGCDYVVGTMFQKTSFMTPRMARRRDGQTAPLCGVRS